MVEWVKMMFIDLNAQNILIPWIYLFYNSDFHEQAVKEERAHNKVLPAGMNSPKKQSY